MKKRDLSMGEKTSNTKKRGEIHQSHCSNNGYRQYNYLLPTFGENGTTHRCMMCLPMNIVYNI